MIFITAYLYCKRVASLCGSGRTQTQCANTKGVLLKYGVVGCGVRGILRGHRCPQRTVGEGTRRGAGIVQLGHQLWWCWRYYLEHRGRNYCALFLELLREQSIQWIMASRWQIAGVVRSGGMLWGLNGRVQYCQWPLEALKVILVLASGLRLNANNLF